MFKELKQKWEENWLRMVGHADQFPIEGRIFHAISIIAIIAVFVIAIYNFLTSLRSAALISSSILLVQIVLYFLSRYKMKYKFAIVLSVIQINISIALAYFYNAGLSGSILLLFMVSLYLIFLIIPRKKLLGWYFLNLTLVLGALAIEYVYPQSIQQHYSSRTEWFIDMAFTYIIVSIMIAVGTVQLRRSYRTQKERAEEKAVKLELMNKEKDKLFSIIGHDLNTPINALQQYLQLLSEMDVNTEDRLSVERELSKSLSDAQYLLSNLLEWAKNQLQNIPMSLERMPIETQMLPTLRMFEQIASRKKINLIVEIDPEASILADHNMFDLVMRNLLNNAMKFTNIGGIIQVGTVLQEERCVIFVKDNGIGISPERQSEIFSLNIASSYGTMNEKGTGLGLALCRDYIIQQGGQIWFSSIEQEGTVFYVEMPRVG